MAIQSFATGLYNFVNNGGWITVLVIGAFGIIMAMAGMVLTLKNSGFNIYLCIADAVLFVFWIWAICKGVVKPILRHPEYFKVKECDNFTDLFKDDEKS